MKKFYYQVINPTTKEVINPCYEPREDQDGVAVPFKLLEKGVQIVRVQVKEWNQIETLEDAIYKLGKDDPFVELYNQFKDVSESYYPKDVLAYLKLRIITAAINDGWEPTEGKPRWNQWFCVYTTKQLSKMAKVDRERILGGGYAKADGCYLTVEPSSVPHVGVRLACVGAVRLAFETEEKANYAAEKFIDVYADYLLP